MGRLGFFDARSSKLVTTIGSAHEDEVTDVCWASDERIVTTGLDGTFSLWDIRTRRALISKQAEESLNAVKCDGSRVITGGELGTIKLWEPSSSQFSSSKHMLPLPDPDCVVSFDVAPDSSLVVVGTSEGSSNLFLLSNRV